jgi:hypothetical protein
MPIDPAVGSPLWWVARLEKKLIARQPRIIELGAYYEGNHPLPVAHEKLRESFARMLRLSRANWTGLIVDAVAERLHVEGFRLGESPASDDDVWAIWQGNDLDAESEMIHIEALVCGESYVTVWANPKDAETPLISLEHPAQMITENDRGNHRELAAAFKLWDDDWTGGRLATLYLPDGIHKFSTPKAGGAWKDRDEVLPNPLGVVPVAVFANRPRLLTGGRSEIGDVLDIQDRVNKTLFDRAMAAEYSSFRQRYSIGMEIPVDEHGQPKAPFVAAVDRLWMAEDPDVKFGEFSATDLGPYIEAVESDVRMMAAISRTPPHYLLGAMVNISGDALKAAESGLSSKAGSRTRQFGEAWERVVRLAFGVLEDPRSKERSSEVIWRDVETRTEGERVDALTKMATLGVPRVALWERWGATPQEIDRWQDLAFQEALEKQAVDLTGLGEDGAEVEDQAAAAEL